MTSGAALIRFSGRQKKGKEEGDTVRRRLGTEEGNRDEYYQNIKYFVYMYENLKVQKRKKKH